MATTSANLKIFNLEKHKIKRIVNIENVKVLSKDQCAVITGGAVAEIQDEEDL